MEAPDWPSQELALALVRRLADDAAAHADFLAAVYLPLLSDVQSTHSSEDPTRVADVVGDLVLGFVRNPQQYDPGRATLRAYLQMAADGDLRNDRAKEARRRAREIPLERVAEPAADGKEEDADDVRAWLADPRVAAVLAGFEPAERAVWDLMLTGERGTAACATALGLADRPASEQERAVKRMKDRIKARLRRAKEAAT